MATQPQKTATAPTTTAPVEATTPVTDATPTKTDRRSLNVTKATYNRLISEGGARYGDTAEEVLCRILDAVKAAGLKV